MARGFFLPLFLIIPALIFLVAWAPWISNDFATARVKKSLGNDCFFLPKDRYEKNKQADLGFSERLKSLAFGKNLTFYVFCSPPGAASKNDYYISFLGTVHKNSSIYVPYYWEDIKDSIENSDWKTYTNSKFRFALRYPNSWSMTYENNFGVAFQKGESKLEITFVEPNLGVTKFTGEGIITVDSKPIQFSYFRPSEGKIAAVAIRVFGPGLGSRYSIDFLSANTEDLGELKAIISTIRSLD